MLNTELLQLKHSSSASITHCVGGSLMVKHLSTSLLNTEKKLCKLLLHKDILTIYKNHNRQPKGFNIKFNLSLCAKNKDLQRSCKPILNKASRNIKEIIKAVNIDIHHLKGKRKQLKTELYNTMLHNEFKTKCRWIKKKVDGIQRTVRQRHSRKLLRDKIDLHSKNIQEKRSKNRRFSRDEISVKKKNKRKGNKNNNKQRIALAKENGPDQNAIKLSCLNLTSSQKSLLAKGPSFIPTPADINRYGLRNDFTTFANQLRCKAKQLQSTSIEPSESKSNNISNSLLSPPVRHARYTPLYRAKETNIKSLELFIEKIEKDIFDTAAVRNVLPNISKEEKEALKEIRSWNNQTVRVQDKRSRFVILGNDDYEQKVQTQINRSVFKQLGEDPSKMFGIQINNRVLKWHNKKVLNDKWKSYIISHNPRPGKMYGNIKTHKTDNPARVVTSGCNTPVEHLSVFVEKVLYVIASELPSRIKDTNHMLDIIDDLNNLNLHPESVLVSFDIINMFPSIDNKMEINSVKFLDERTCKDPPTKCVIEALELCLSCNNSVFNNTNYIQTVAQLKGLICRARTLIWLWQDMTVKP